MNINSDKSKEREKRIKCSRIHLPAHYKERNTFMSHQAVKQI